MLKESENALIERMRSGEVLNGFYMLVGRTEIFIETAYKNRSNQLAKKIAHKLLIPDDPAVLKEILYYISPAQCKIMDYVWEGNRYEGYVISGKNFGGCGSANINDGKTVVVRI